MKLSLKDQTREKVIKIIAGRLNIDEKKVRPDSRLMDDLGADSLCTIEIIIDLETEFKIEIPDETAQNIYTVQDAILFVSKRVKLITEDK